MIYLYLWLFSGSLSAAYFWYEGNDREFDFYLPWLAFCLFLVLLGPITILFCIAGAFQDRGSTDNPNRYRAALTEWDDSDRL